MAWFWGLGTVWEDAESSEPFVGGKGEKRRVRAKNLKFPSRC